MSLTKHLRIFLRKLINATIGTTFDELIWSFKYKKNEQQILLDWWNIEDRLFLLTKISEVSFDSVLELGSNCGPNLRMIAKHYPNARIAGTDISKNSVALGNRLFLSSSINNVNLYFGKAHILNFPDKSFDLVFTFAVLLYVGPDKIEAVLNESIRVAKKRILFLEWHDGSVKNYNFKEHWIYNFMFLLQKFKSRISSFSIVKIPSDEFSDINWKRYGYFIDIILK